MRGLQVGAGAQRTTQIGWHRLAMVLACVLARTDSRTCKNSCVVSVTVDRECVSAVRCSFALENVLGASVAQYVRVRSNLEKSSRVSGLP